MDELARRAGVSKPVIYDHFGSKEQLFALCVRRTGEALADRVATAVRKESEPRARLWAGSVAYFRFLHGQLTAWEVLFAEDEQATDARFAAEAARIRHRQSDLMLRLMAETTGLTPSDEQWEHLEATTLAVAGAYESLAPWWQKHPDAPPEQLADWLLDLLWPGLEQLMEQIVGAAHGAGANGPDDPGPPGADVRTPAA